ncbi:MFS transporter [Pyrobaculum calidifontis]|uniref:Major facilitator superfamily MFS_1 n=1 Tax=Pyrobaculum calidifontis (strain DSM 21063 / JCM 11548 / VA1) TaxID=410359 RepID=A3MTJ0_PYRCJ|nr:MFS transporter [Pyrobaculum calidifontis]ABO07957.1 major facilitator superfamily MFS_1 [Pyrobaculum calidifontis JCM 11548]
MRLILAARALYALMWFYVAPVLPQMLKEFGVDASSAGLLPAMFIVGTGVMQIPASYLGGKLGFNKVAGAGMAIFGASSLLLSLSNSWWEALLLRALGGVGAGLFFSTAGALIVAYMPDAVATALGWYSASFNIGAFVGFYWGYVASLTGWRLALAIPGALAIVLGVLIFRGPPLKGASKFSWRAYSFGLASFPFWGSVYAANSLAATWAHLHRGVAESVAGALSSAAMASGFLGGFFGRLYDKTQKKLRFLTAAPLLAAGAYALTPFAPVYALFLLAFTYGAAFSAYITAIYATASKVSQDPSSALAVVNVTNMALGLHVSYIFSWLMAYSPALPWEFLAALAASSSLATYAVAQRTKFI